MADVIMYTTASCPYCSRARGLLQQKNMSFTEIRVDEAPEKRVEMQELGGGRTVPQIFIDGKHIGGCDDMFALEQQGKLDELLV